jgi:hypothetical protein
LGEEFRPEVLLRINFPRCAEFIAFMGFTSKKKPVNDGWWLSIFFREGTLFQRKYITSLLVLIFTVVAVTGVFMLLHVRSRPLAHLHEWMGLFFVVLGIIHAALNWSFIKAYLGQGQIRFSFVVVLLLSLVLFFGTTNDQQGMHGQSSHGLRTLEGR